ncbi:MAG: glycosyltransferase, partial [Planctomycetota bacterium]|nr:glycosyltransferase [Planctomycetota bacterium]
AGLHVKGSYRFEDVPGMLSGIDAGLVPSVWWDNGPQTVMEYLACGVPVIGAALGGIVDLVHDGENGLLFRGNDRFHLASTLARVCREPALLATLRGGVTPPRSISEHATVMEAEYRALVAARKHL